MRFFSFKPVPLRQVALLCLLAGTARAQTAPPDSARLSQRRHRLGEVQVRAVGPERFAVGSTRIELDSAALSQYRGASLAEALQARTPLALKNYGPGQLATIALRGTSAQHTAVLWNGLNIMLPTLGQNDFALLPVGATTGVAVQAGPGSFGLRGGSLDVRGAGGAVAVGLAASYRQANNNYTYLSPEFGGPVRRTVTSAALRHQWSWAPEVAWRLGTAGQLMVAAWLTETDRDIQAAVGTTDRHARELDQSRRFVLGYRHQATAQAQWAVRGAWFEDVLNYRDDGLRSDSRVRTTQGQAEYTTALSGRGTLRLGAEAQYFAATLAEYTRPDATENRAAAFALLRFDPRPNVRLSANLRQSFLPQANPFAPTLGLEWDFWTTPTDSLSGAAGEARHQQVLRFRASTARSYRAPTLNERFWRVGGNPNLRPESGLGAEAGLVHRLPWGRRLVLETELTAYRQLVDDWVQWAPGPDNLWSPRNLRQVLTQGLETSSQATWQQGRHRFGARAAYHYTYAYTHRATAADPVPAGQPLPYVPAHTAAASLDYSWRGWRASANGTFSSFRYTDAGAQAYLPGYGLLGGSLGYALALPGAVQALLLVQGTNLLDRAYDSYEARPAPPRAALLSLRLSWR